MSRLVNLVAGDCIKRCYKCGETRPTSQFGEDKSRRDGFQPRCRICAHAYYLARSGGFRKLPIQTDEQKGEARKRCVKKYRKKNWSKIVERVRLSGRCSERNARRRTQTPAWADADKILAFYQLVPLVNEETGVRHHVDHIVPLKSPIVCGLHCEDNLRVISALENIVKGNRYWPDMPK